MAGDRTVDRQCVEHLVFQSFDGVTLRLSLDDGGSDIAKFVMGQIERVKDLARRAAGRAVKVEVDASRCSPRQPEESASGAALPEIVRKAVDLLGATVVSVQRASFGESPLQSPHV